MYAPRYIRSPGGWSDADQIKLYAISVTEADFDPTVFFERLEVLKRDMKLNWRSTPAFAIFHRGMSHLYLVLCWWGNQNELFTSVSVLEQGLWVIDPTRFSFCIWDMEVFWYERSSYIKHMYSGRADLAAYRQDIMPSKGLLRQT
jgi:hypothetical protein